jgi:serine/threonine protein kinase
MTMKSWQVMSKLKTPIELETAFNNYQLTEQLGEGGAGRVYGGVDSAGAAVAVKVLTSESKDKRRRFKNEIAFLSRNRHKNIVTVTDYGVAAVGVVNRPFYVMARYGGSLRDVLKHKLTPDRAMALFSQVIDGVEAAHLQNVTHRDLKPENVLTDLTNDAAAVSDFGVASFTEDQMLTLVDTAPTTRLANFQYAAPEQRISGGTVGPTADIYALG